VNYRVDGLGFYLAETDFTRPTRPGIETDFIARSGGLGGQT